MAYCVKCGAKVNDGVQYCPQCGAKIPVMPGAGQQQDSQQGYTYQQNGQQDYTYQQGYTYQQNNQQGYSGQQQNGRAGEFFQQDDVSQNKVMGVLSYLGILVFVPLIAGNKQSPVCRSSITNQGLGAFIASILVDLLDGRWLWGFHSMINFGGRRFSAWIFDIWQPGAVLYS
ncbi:MAG: zinc ribbon domain-containing protein [[Clostridium] scindens]